MVKMVEKLIFSHKNEDNFLTKQNLKNSSLDCADIGLIILCIRGN